MTIKKEKENNSNNIYRGLSRNLRARRSLVIFVIYSVLISEVGEPKEGELPRQT
jgi:hypothetical protein